MKLQKPRRSDRDLTSPRVFQDGPLESSREQRSLLERLRKARREMEGEERQASVPTTSRRP